MILQVTAGKIAVSLWTHAQKLPTPVKMERIVQLTPTIHQMLFAAAREDFMAAIAQKVLQLSTVVNS